MKMSFVCEWEENVRTAHYPYTCDRGLSCGWKKGCYFWTWIAAVICFICLLERCVIATAAAPTAARKKITTCCFQNSDMQMSLFPHAVSHISFSLCIPCLVLKTSVLTSFEWNWRGWLQVIQAVNIALPTQACFTMLDITTYSQTSVSMLSFLSH